MKFKKFAYIVFSVFEFLFLNIKKLINHAIYTHSNLLFDIYICNNTKK